MDASHSKRTTAATQAQTPQSGYALIEAILDAVHSASLLRELKSLRRNGRHHGRNGIPSEALWRAFLLQFVLNIRYANRFLDTLNADQRLADICGLDRPLTEATYSRFKSRIARNPDLQSIVDQAIAECTTSIHLLIEEHKAQHIISPNAPQLGTYLAIDSTDIPAYGRPPRKSEQWDATDPDAKWGHRTRKRSSPQQGKTEAFYGYKEHTIVDALYGVPLASITLPANESDVKQLLPLIEHIRTRHPHMPLKYIMCDKAYDSRNHQQTLVNNGTIPITPLRAPSNTNLHGGIFTEKGIPTCVGGAPMQYLESDTDKGHRFRCDPEGCHLKNGDSLFTTCDSDYWEKPEGIALRVVGVIPRFTVEWKQLYKMRQTVERFFRSAKHSRLLDRHQSLGIAKIRLHAKMSRIAYLATMIARLRTGNFDKIRHMTTK